MQETRKNFCTQCNCETIQNLLATKTHFEVREIFSKTEDGLHKDSLWFVLEAAFEFLQCAGCGRPSLKIVEGPADSEHKETRSFPPKPSLPKPDWIKDLPTEYYPLLSETYRAMNEGLYSLALMGMRALLDIYMSKIAGDVGGFKKKLDALVKSQHITPMQKETLDIAIDFGSAASHRGYQPKFDVAMDILAVVENILKAEISHLKIKKNKAELPRRQ